MKSIAVHLGAQHKIVVSEDGHPDWVITHFSTGRQGHRTPMLSGGHHLSNQRELMHYSGKYRDARGKPAAMPFAMFFDDGSGCAFHGGNPDLESHGCIHLALDDARHLFEWAGHDKVALTIQAA